MQEMIHSPSHRRLISLLHRSGLSDRELEEVFGVHQSTVWRLKNGKIDKVQPYIEELEKHLGTGPDGTIEALLDDLLLWSTDSPELCQMLASLHRLMQDSA